MPVVIVSVLNCPIMYAVIVQVAQLWQRPRELGDFKKARVNGGIDDDSLKDSHKSLRCRWQTRIIW